MVEQQLTMDFLQKFLSSSLKLTGILAILNVSIAQSSNPDGTDTYIKLENLARL